jgi:hypothetical protein
MTGNNNKNLIINEEGIKIQDTANYTTLHYTTLHYTTLFIINSYYKGEDF